MQNFDLENYKSDANSRRKGAITLLVLFLFTGGLWIAHFVSGEGDLHVAALYPTLVLLFTAPQYFMFHVVRGADSDPLTWYSSPLIWVIPGLLVCFYYMFR